MRYNFFKTDHGVLSNCVRESCAGFLLLLVLSGLLSAGCGRKQLGSSDSESGSDVGTDSDEPLLTIRPVDPSGQSVGAFTAVVFEDNDVFEWRCSDAGDILAPCDEKGIIFATIPDSLTVTLKARGYAFVSQSWTREELTTGQRDISVTLSPLAPFERNDDFATGFDAQTEVDDFVQYGVKSPSDLGQQYLVKFYMENIDTSPTVYFMNSSVHRLHYPFVNDVLKKHIDELQYMQETYVDENRTAIAGTLMFFPQATVPVASAGVDTVSPMVLTFFASDKLTPKHAAIAHRLIEERLGFLSLNGNEKRFFYLPPGDAQLNAVLADVGVMYQSGAWWMEKSQLYANISMQILNSGEAYGTLRRMDSADIGTAAVSYRDILILTSLPNELPPVAGTITEELQTPLSHVNVAAMNRGTPNIALLDAGNHPDVSPYIGTPVHFEVSQGDWTIEPATAAEVEAFWESRQRPAVTLESDIEYVEMLEFDVIGFADASRIGAKAANVAQLSHLLNDSAPYGFAVPFYYYEQFMNSAVVTEAACVDAMVDCIEEGRAEDVCNTAKGICLLEAGKTMNEYAASIAANEQFSANSVLREALLDGLRHHMRHVEIDPSVTTELNNKISTLFGTQKVRLRSSTNAEDLSDFSGAGLYNSVSAYGSGAQKLASKQIRKVWASLWNWRAFEERSLWNMDHLSVKMGVLVHQAYPDEAANGVLITQNLAEPMVEGFYVNVQKGEASVTNPEQGTPEVFAVIAGNGSVLVQSAVYAWSSLSPDARILSDDEVQQLYKASRQAQAHFASLYDIDPYDLAVFDMEFKFVGEPRNLVIKQIRPFTKLSN